LTGPAPAAADHAVAGDQPETEQALIDSNGTSGRWSTV
jgi:hypothetical protein